MSFVKKMGKGIKDRVNDKVNELKEKYQKEKEYRETYDKEFEKAYHKERLEAEKYYARKKAKEDIRKRKSGTSGSGLIKLKNPADVRLIDDDWDKPLEKFAENSLVNPTTHYHKKRGGKYGRTTKRRV